MSKEVIIKIKGTQGLNGQEDTIELMTEGKIAFRDGEVLLSYLDSEITAGEGVKTQVRIQADNTVTISRLGAVRSKLVIRQGERITCLYGTVGGNLSLGIYGERVENRLTENGGSLILSYNIDANLEPLSKNTVEIEVKNKKN